MKEWKRCYQNMWGPVEGSNVNSPLEISQASSQDEGLAVGRLEGTHFTDGKTQPKKRDIIHGNRYEELSSIGKTPMANGNQALMGELAQ